MANKDNYIDTPTVLFQFEIQGADDVLNVIESFKDRLESTPVGETPSSNNLVRTPIYNLPNNSSIPYNRSYPTATVLKRQLAISDNNTMIARSKLKLQQEVNKGKKLDNLKQNFSLDKLNVGLQLSQERVNQKNINLAVSKELTKQMKINATIQEQLTKQIEIRSKAKLAEQQQKTKQLKEKTTQLNLKLENSEKREQLRKELNDRITFNKIRATDNLYSNKKDYDTFKDYLRKENLNIKDSYSPDKDFRIKIEQSNNESKVSDIFSKMYSYVKGMEQSSKSMASNFKGMEQSSSSFVKNFQQGFKQGLAGYSDHNGYRHRTDDPIRQAGQEMGQVARNIRPAVQMAVNPAQGIAMGAFLNTLGQSNKEEKISKITEMFMTDPQLSTSEGNNSMQDFTSHATTTVNIEEVKKDLKGQRVADLDYVQSVTNLAQGLISVKNDHLNEDNKNLKFNVDPKTGIKKASVVKDADLDPSLRTALDFIKYSKGYTTDDEALNYLKNFGIGDAYSLTYDFFNSSVKHTNEGDSKTVREILNKLQKFIPQLTWNSATGGNIYFAANPVIDKNTGKGIPVLQEGVLNVLELGMAGTMEYSKDPKTGRLIFKKDNNGNYIFNNLVDDKTDMIIEDIGTGANLTSSAVYIESTGNVETLHNAAKKVKAKSQEVMQGLHLSFNIMDDMIDDFINFVSGGNDFIEKSSKKEEREQAVNQAKGMIGSQYTFGGY